MAHLVANRADDAYGAAVGKLLGNQRTAVHQLAVKAYRPAIHALHQRGVVHVMAPVGKPVIRICARLSGIDEDNGVEHPVLVGVKACEIERRVLGGGKLQELAQKAVAPFVEIR